MIESLLRARYGYVGQHHLRAGGLRTFFGGFEVAADQNPIPLATLGLVGGANDQVGTLLIDAVVADLQDRIDTVVIDQFDHYFDVGTFLALGVLLDFRPRVEDAQIGVGDFLAPHQLLSGLGEALDLGGAADDGDLLAGLLSAHGVLDNPGVGAAQDRIGVRHLDQLRGDLLEALESQRSLQEVQELVGLIRYSGAEAEALREDETVGGLEGAHRIDGSAPTVDRLAAIAHHNPLSMSLFFHDPGDNRVGILGLIKHHEIAAEPGMAERPDLQVMIVREVEATARARQILPSLTGVRGDVMSVRRMIFDALHLGHMALGDLIIGAVAEAPDGFVRAASDHPSRNVLLVIEFEAASGNPQDRDLLCGAQLLASEAAHQATAFRHLHDPFVGQRMGRAAFDVGREDHRRIGLNCLVIGDIDAPAVGGLGHQAERGSLAGASTGLDNHALASGECVDGCLLLGSRRKIAHGTQYRGSFNQSQGSIICPFAGVLGPVTAARNLGLVLVFAFEAVVSVRVDGRFVKLEE